VPVVVAAPPVVPAQGPPAAAATHVGTPGRPRIVLDPGHGGSDPGATGFVVEKELTLDLAQQVAVLLREQGADVVLTRDDDSTVPLSARTARANAEQADLFVSIHGNANPGGTLEGIETYVLDDSTDHAVLRLASMENGLDMLHPPDGGAADLRYILSDLVQGGKMEESTALAGAIQDDLVRGLRRRWSGVTDLGVKRGPFYVLVGAYMPCVLVEVSFLTHPTEGRRLVDPAYRASIAHGIAAGIARFLADDAHTRTL
jgi:N-acetylmuramoyl-L-alanine amidase